MKSSSDLDQLTGNMAQRQKGYTDNPSECQEPYILFLGAGCSLAAGVPSIDQIAEKELTRRADPSAASGGSIPPAPPYDPSDKAGSLKRFYKWLEPMSAGHVFRLFQAHYANTPVPLFYQDLALLIKNRFFNRILTTNFDTLLEQALSGAGLLPDVDFAVTNFGFSSRPNDPPNNRATGSGFPPDCAQEPVSIVKLHGDLAEGQLMITPSQIEESLKSLRSAAKQELKGDMVMVGYKFESPLLNSWLSSFRKRELWWVSEEPEGQETIQSWGEDISSINGDLGRPEEFFSQLALRLLRLPALQSQRQQTETVLSLGRSKSINIGLVGDVPPDAAPTFQPDDDEVLADDLRGQIRRVQASLYSLEQKASPDERPASLQAQIDYQKQQIILLEDRLRSLSGSKPKLLELLKTFTDNLQVAMDDPKVVEHISGATVDFLRTQYHAVKEQYSSGEPNQQIISAAVGAAAILAERLYVELGSEIVKPEEVRDLASFVPTTATRGIK